MKGWHCSLLLMVMFLLLSKQNGDRAWVGSRECWHQSQQLDRVLKFSLNAVSTCTPVCSRSERMRTRALDFQRGDNNGVTGAGVSLIQLPWCMHSDLLTCLRRHGPRERRRRLAYQCRTLNGETGRDSPHPPPWPTASTLQS